MRFDLSHIDTGATAWVLASAALVLFMTPGVAFFYGGMVRARHVLAMIMQNFVTIALVSVVWVAVGYSLAFGKGNGFVGDLHFAWLAHMDQAVPGFSGPAALVIPPLVFALFQMMFAVITPALITGATADRWRFSSFVPFVVLWSVLVYSPVAHWIFSPVGWLARLGAQDFAGGIVVHANAGVAALVMALLLGRRSGWPQAQMKQHNMPLMLIGAGILWFGWFGFNAGSALGADQLAATAFVNTNTAGAAAMLAWLGWERLRHGRATSLGAASGAVAGLAAITPCAGYVSPAASLVIGTAAGLVCAYAVGWKTRLGYDDSLDVIGVHLVGGVLGSLAVGLFATRTVNPASADGLLHGGGTALLGKQAIALAAVMAYSATITLLLGLILRRITGNRVTAQAEHLGLDLALHGENGYALDLPEASQAVQPVETTRAPGDHSNHATHAASHEAPGSADTPPPGRTADGAMPSAPQLSPMSTTGTWQLVLTDNPPGRPAEAQPAPGPHGPDIGHATADSRHRRRQLEQRHSHQLEVLDTYDKALERLAQAQSDLGDIVTEASEAFGSPQAAAQVLLNTHVNDDPRPTTPNQ